MVPLSRHAPGEDSISAVLWPHLLKCYRSQSQGHESMSLGMIPARLVKNTIKD